MSEIPRINKIQINKIPVWNTQVPIINKPIVDLKKIDPLPIDPTPAIPPRDDIQQPLEVERRYRQIVEEGRKQKEMEERSGIGGILLK